MWLTRPTYPGQSPPGLIGYPSPSSPPSRRPRSPPPCCHGGALRRLPPRRLPGAVGKKRCEGPRVAHHHLWVEGGCAGLLSVRVHLLARPAEELRHRPVPWTRRPVLHRRFPACVV
ncbi:hypothetical protein PVAP13_5NG340843 [Panicum virgatum]|uniref:Uncharacterized protein n=1 Tax=Panicum virgatum TaxID=38727 RepID=A0A8T0RTS7_PANVG|nr:hypothetical protein PVAP13_5NG340843 [Panicum virgatum]